MNKIWFFLALFFVAGGRVSIMGGTLSIGGLRAAAACILLFLGTLIYPAVKKRLN